MSGDKDRRIGDTLHLKNMTIYDQRKNLKKQYLKLSWTNEANFQTLKRLYFQTLNKHFLISGQIVCHYENQGQAFKRSSKAHHIFHYLHHFHNCYKLITNAIQGSRVRPIWSHVWPNFSSLRDSESLSLLFNNRHVRLISWSKPIRDSEGRTFLWLAVVQIFLYVCVRLKMRVLLQSDRER